MLPPACTSENSHTSTAFKRGVLFAQCASTNARFDLSPLILYDLVFCNQSAVSMRFGSGLPACKFTLLSRSGTASWATDGKSLF